MPPTAPPSPPAQPAAVLLLGGTGFAGRALAAVLAAAGHAVVAVSRHCPPEVGPRVVGLPESGRAGRGGSIERVAADLARADLAGLIGRVRPGLVVNAAGAVWRPAPRQLAESNVLLVARVLAALGAHAPGCRFLQLGSAKEYGPQPPGRAVPEDAPACPSDGYGAGKLAATGLVLAATERGLVQGTVLRLPTLIGPGSPPASLAGQVSAELAAAARQRRRAVLRLSPLTARQDFLDVADLAAAVLAARPGGATVGRVVNLGCGSAVSVRDVVGSLIARSGVPATILGPDPLPVITGGPPSRSVWQWLDITAARALLGWAPRIPVDESLARTWDAAMAQDAPR